MQGVTRTFVGRDRELVELEHGLDEARSGRGRLFLLSGEAGIGKTRLCDELALRASDQGFRVRWGRCWEAGGAPAYWPWIQVLRALLREPETLALGAYGRDTLARLLPELGTETPASGQPNSAEQRFALFDAVASALREAASASPLLVILDDLHAADPSSLALLLFVARELRDLRVCLMATYREREMLSSPDARDALTRIAREAHTFELSRFTPAEVRALLHARTHGVDDGTLDSVFRTTEGLPLFVAEVARARPAAGTASNWVLPDTIRAALSARIEALSEPVREVLEAAAVLGRETSHSVLGAVVGRSESDLRAPLSAALAAGIATEPEPGWVGFSHALLREAIYRELPEARRVELHERAADALSRAQAPETGWAEIANHLWVALPRVGPERALTGSLRAAERALRAFAFEDAVVILDQAFAALGDREVPARLRCEALLILGEARIRAHRGGREACLAAAEIARTLSDATLLARAGLALGAEIWAGRVNPVLIALLEESLRALPEAPSALRARVLARLAGAMQPAFDPQQPIALAREAIAMARGLDDPPSLRIVLLGAGSALVDYAPIEERLDVDQQTLTLAEAARDWPLAFRAQLRLYFDHLQRGTWSAADNALHGCETIIEKFRQPPARWYVALMNAVHADARGEFAAADASRARAEALMADQEDDSRRGVFALHCFASALLRHTHARLSARVPLSSATAGMPPELAQPLQAVLLAICHAREDRSEQAAHTLRGVDFQSGAFRYELTALYMASDVAITCNLSEPAAPLLDCLRSFDDQFFSWGVWGFGVFGPVSGARAGLLGVLERYAEAFAAFEVTTVRCRQLGAQPALARTLYDHARARIRRGQDGDRELARALLDEAASLALSMQLTGLSAWVEVARDTCTRADPEPAPKTAAADGSQRTTSSAPARALAALRATTFSLAREGDVWVVSHGERTFRLKHSRGLAMLARLVEQPGREVHALALGDAGDPGELGDAGAAVDGQAVRAYRERIEALREQEQTADMLADADAAERARTEIERIAQHLSAALGMGGKDRRAASAAERARVNVRRRIKDAIDRITREDAELGRYLSLSVRTGTFSVFQPIP